MTDEIPTKEKLARALEERGNPRLKRMIRLARKGYYDDYESPITLPIKTLHDDLMAYGETELAERVKEGEFDATADEAERWANSLEGMEAFSDNAAVEGAKELARRIAEVNGLRFDEDKWDHWVAKNKIGE